MDFLRHVFHLVDTRGLPVAVGSTIYEESAHRRVWRCTIPHVLKTAKADTPSVCGNLLDHNVHSQVLELGRAQIVRQGSDLPKVEVGRCYRIWCH